MKKFLLIALSLVILLSLMSCKSDSDDQTVNVPDKKFTLNMFTGEGVFLMESGLPFKGGTNLYDVLINIFKERDIPYTDIDGFFTKIGDYENNDEYGWLYEVDNVTASVGVKEYILNGGETVNMFYMNYNDYFSQRGY